MSQNLIKRIITSIILLSLLFLVSFSNQYIFILSILILGIIICIEANNLFLKLLKKNQYGKTSLFKKFNIKFLTLNIIALSYIFLVFCNFSYEIYKYEGSIFFFIHN